MTLNLYNVTKVILNTNYIEKIDKANNLIYLRNNMGTIPIGKKFLDGVY